MISPRQPQKQAPRAHPEHADVSYNFKKWLRVFMHVGALLRKFASGVPAVRLRRGARERAFSLVTSWQRVCSAARHENLKPRHIYDGPPRQCPEPQNT
eukprot:3988021-Pyramimonas_sp.AAC.1